MCPTFKNHSVIILNNEELVIWQDASLPHYVLRKKKYFSDEIKRPFFLGQGQACLSNISWERIACGACGRKEACVLRLAASRPQLSSELNQHFF